ncbi:WD40 repeat-containing protein, partial [Reticulomyxa filosa]
NNNNNNEAKESDNHYYNNNNDGDDDDDDDDDDKKEEGEIKKEEDIIITRNNTENEYVTDLFSHPELDSGTSSNNTHNIRSVLPMSQSQPLPTSQSQPLSMPSQNSQLAPLTDLDDIVTRSRTQTINQDKQSARRIAGNIGHGPSPRSRLPTAENIGALGGLPGLGSFNRAVSEEKQIVSLPTFDDAEKERIFKTVENENDTTFFKAFKLLTLSSQILDTAITNINGDTPLHMFCINNKDDGYFTERLTYLISYCEEWRFMKNKQGKIPLHYALFHQNGEMMDLLLSFV